MQNTQTPIEPQFSSAAAARLYQFAYIRLEGKSVAPQMLILEASKDATFAKAWLAYAIAGGSHPHELALAFACAQLHQLDELQFVTDFWQEPGRAATLSVSDAKSEYEKVTAEFGLAQHISDELLLAWIGICAQATLPLDHQVFADEISQTASGLPVDALRALKDFARSRLQVTQVYDEHGEPIQKSSVRNNDQCLTMLPRTEIELACIERYLAHMYRIPVAHAESLVIYRYTEGQEYKWHYDFITALGASTEDELKTLGQRYRTSILYLSDDFSGGSTAFKHSGLSLTGKVGDVVSFVNMTKEARVNKRSLHRGSPVTAGEKWIATQWFRTSPNWLRAGLLFW